jgi:hypothetical protein
LGAGDGNRTRTVSWEVDCHASADQHVAGQLPCSVVCEYPPDTVPDPPIGHAAGTFPACQARRAQAPNPLIRSYEHTRTSATSGQIRASVDVYRCPPQTALVAVLHCCTAICLRTGLPCPDALSWAAQHERLRRIASGARAQQAHPDLQRQEHRLLGVPHLQPFVERREAGPRCPPHQSRSSRRRRYPRAASRRHARSGPSECALAATRARLTGDRCRCSMPAYDLDRSTAGTPCGTVGVRSSRRGPRRLPRAPRGRQRSASTFPPWNLHQLCLLVSLSSTRFFAARIPQVPGRTSPLFDPRGRRVRISADLSRWSTSSPNGCCRVLATSRCRALYFGR